MAHSVTSVSSTPSISASSTPTAPAPLTPDPTAIRAAPDISGARRMPPRVSVISDSISSSAKEAEQDDAVKDPPLDTFQLDGVFYRTLPTLGDSACALHALIGKLIQGVVRYSKGDDRGFAVKSYFQEKLRKALQDGNEVIHELLNKALSEIFNRNEQSLEKQLIFLDEAIHKGYLTQLDSEKILRNEIVTLETQEGSIWVELLDSHPEIYDLIRQNEKDHREKTNDELKAFLTKNPQKLFAMANSDRREFLALLSEIEKMRIAVVNIPLKDLQDNRDQSRITFLLSQPVIDHYLKCILNSRYYISQEELKLAAHLFNIPLRLLSHYRGGFRQFDDDIIQLPDSPNAEVIIAHQGIHYSRVIRIDNPEATGTRQPLAASTSDSSSLDFRSGLDTEGSKPFRAPSALSSSQEREKLARESARTEYEAFLKKCNEGTHWDTDGNLQLNLLGVPPNEQDRIRDILISIKKLPEITGRVVSVEKGQMRIKLRLKKRHEHPNVRAYILLAHRLLTKGKIGLARFIINQLHNLDVEEYLLEEAEKAEQFHRFQSAEHYYHLISLMHPFAVYAYCKRANMWREVGEYEKAWDVCKEALRYLDDPEERELVESLLVINFMQNLYENQQEASFNAKQARKLLERLLKMIESQKEKDVPLGLLSHWLDLYFLQIGYSDTPSLRVLYSFAQRMLALAKGDAEIEQMWATRLAELTYQAGFTQEDGIHSKKSYLKGLVHEFGHYPQVTKIFIKWCFENECLHELIGFFETDNRLKRIACLESYHLAKAVTFLNSNIDEAERHFLESHRIANVTWSAFNLGQFYLLVRSNFSESARYFKAAIDLSEDEESQEPRYLALWAALLLGGNREQALRLLKTHLPTHQVAFDLQKQEAPNREEILHAADLSDSYAPQSPPATKQVLLPHISKWVQENRVEIGEGFVGIYLRQKNATKMKTETVEFYRQELEKKKDCIELKRKKDDWIGKGSSPRVDLEEYHPNGNARHFQRLRFQQGKCTYGGLWLPVDVGPIPMSVILAAFEAWIKEKDAAYLVIFNPQHYQDQILISLEIYLMDVENRATFKGEQ